MAKAEPAMKAPSNAVVGITGVGAAAWSERIGRVNWGPSELKAGAGAHAKVAVA